MKRLPLQLFAGFILLAGLYGCDKAESDCGAATKGEYDAYGSFFANPANIYWGVSNGIRSYTYNYEFGNICTKQNPQVSFTLNLAHSNAGAGNPISVNAGTYTCLGVQAQHTVMAPDAQQLFYRGGPSEIGMQQCFSGRTSATIYPYMTVSFNTLGSSYDDSLYLVDNVFMMVAYVDYNAPK